MDEQMPTLQVTGHAQRTEQDDAKAEAFAYRWRLLGLILWLIALSSLLPRAIAAASGYLYSEHLGGFITAVNFPGPKIWATTLLQRSIGYEPAALGSSMTIWAFVNLLAVWLMTTPIRGESSPLRFVARWFSVIGIGLVASLLLFKSSIGVSWRPPDLIYPILALGVEASATLFIYLYLARLARKLNRRCIARVLFFGGFAAAGIILLAIYALIRGDFIHENSRLAPLQAAVACYGAMAVPVAMCLLGSVLQLMPACFRAAFPHGIGLTLRTERTAEVRPICSTCGYDLRGLPTDHQCPECGGQTVMNEDEAQADRFESVWARFVAAGAIVFALVSFPLFYVVLHMDFRYGFGGTLPMLNFTGPKAWGVPALQRSIGSRPESLGTEGAFLCLVSVLAVWLLTWPHPVRVFEEKWFDVRRLARWATVITCGAFFGFALISMGLYVNDKGFWKWLFAAVLLAEAPGTVLCYLYLSRIAGQYLGEREAKLARVTAYLAAGVMLISVFLLPFGTLLSEVTEDGLIEWFFAAGFGSVMLTAGLLGFAVVLRITATLVPFALRGVPTMIVIRK
jgi:predicted RNA-binding Zn-ribbon protein involved in translation (DUF1610 family)